MQALIISIIYSSLIHVLIVLIKYIICEVYYNYIKLLTCLLKGIIQINKEIIKILSKIKSYIRLSYLLWAVLFLFYPYFFIIHI